MQKLKAEISNEQLSICLGFEMMVADKILLKVLFKNKPVPDDISYQIICRTIKKNKGFIIAYIKKMEQLMETNPFMYPEVVYDHFEEILNTSKTLSLDSYFRWFVLVLIGKMRISSFDALEREIYNMLEIINYHTFVKETVKNIVDNFST